MTNLPDKVRLIKALEKESNIVVNSIARCRSLSSWLESRQVFISYSTLSRFYQLTNQVYKTHTSTLDLLSNAVGALSYDHFCNRATDQTIGAILLKQAQMHLSLLQHQNDPDSAVNFFLKKQSENPVIFAELSNLLSKHLFNNQKKNKKAIIKLASSELGRKYFFQYFVDEDDLSGLFKNTLEQYFRKNSNTSEEQMFSNLFCYRKKILKNPLVGGEVLSYLRDIKNDRLVQENKHFYSRWYELYWMAQFLKKKKYDSGQLQEMTMEILNSIKSETNGNEIIACLGRWNRALLLTGAADDRCIPEIWKQRCTIELMQGYRDMEFQSATYAFLAKCKDYVVPKNEVPFNQWDNAVFTSSMFLQPKEYLQDNQWFYQEKLSVNRTFFCNLLK